MRDSIRVLGRFHPIEFGTAGSGKRYMMDLDEPVSCRVSSTTETILDDGCFECRLHPKRNSVFESARIRYNFADGIVRVSDLKMRGHAIITPTVTRRSRNHTVVAFNKKVGSSSTVTQWMVLNLRRTKQRYFIEGAVSVSTLCTCAEPVLDDETLLVSTQLDLPYRDIRRFVFADSTSSLHDVRLPRDVLSIIFDVYETGHFEMHGEPFICDTLELDAQLCRHLLNTHDEQQSAKIVGAFIVSDEECGPCHINGIGIRLVNHDDENFFFSDEFLDEFAFEPESVCCRDRFDSCFV